jgi:geranyl-CoA carboxylase alpha subunit
VDAELNFSKLLVANRGEIACRVLRSARALGYRTVAVYSDADAAAPHVALADEAVRLGPAPAAESYLHVERVLDAARRSGADALHPGYGFLSERADFAQACADRGLVFVGPPAAAIAAMGDKAAAKRRMLAAGVPCAPGYLGDDQSDERLLDEARGLGLPLLVKAVAGGGGRGMRLVHDHAELPAAIAGARREAEAAFGDGRLMLERLIERGRHIEVQVFADAHGHCIHLGERDCSAQRRRQKVLEEAPSPVLTPALRAALGADAVAAARAVGYRGAGTVEFIVDSDLRHCFLEMNTRLQVEHPVTECLTGLDLVEWQLRVAAGEPLPLTQDQVRCDGHAIEVRLYAEDPYAGFVPQTGSVRHWRPEAALRAGVRIDHGLAEGNAVTPHYDALLAKLIAHGRDRSDAIRRLRAALADAPLLGVVHNGGFLHDLLADPAFVEARLHTGLLDQWLAARAPLLQPPAVADDTWALAAALLAWAPGEPLRAASVAAWDLALQAGRERRTLRVQPQGRSVVVTAGARRDEVEILAWDGAALRYAVDGVQRRGVALREGDTLHLAQGAGVCVLREVSAWPQADDGPDPRRARAPVAGVVAAVRVAPGDVVAAGAALVCVEAMKIEMWLHAERGGRVVAVHVEPRASVEAGRVLVELELPETP